MVFYISIILTGIFYFALLLVNKIDSDTTATLQVRLTNSYNYRAASASILNLLNLLKIFDSQGKNRSRLI